MVLVTLLVTLLTPKQYSSEMQFLVQNARGNVVVTPERTSSSDVVSGVTEEQVNSELVILHSHELPTQLRILSGRVCRRVSGSDCDTPT